MYNNFSYYYDLMMQDVCYDIFVDIVKENVSLDKTILDCGCGTGNVSIPLAKDGYNITGIDLSSDMLTICKSKQEKENVNFPLYENNLEEEIGFELYDCCISFLDVINYVDYKLAFKNIYDCLKCGGIFIFDVNDFNYQESMKNYVEEDTNDLFSYTWKILDNGVGKIKHDLTIKTKDDEFREIHYQETYPKEVYIKELESLGFKVEILIDDNIKVFFKCIK
ncbi:MAG: class I SAM-dependent methyltransferase [Acholeplasmatales bacterium]|nr:class I SAM-dependent methyltransferase [Acholeplasmatales bacterium]